MDPSNYQSNISARLESIGKLGEEVKKSEAVVRGKLSSLGKTAWLTDKEGNIPEWAKHHILLTKQLEVAVKEFEALQQTTPLSKEALKSLKPKGIKKQLQLQRGLRTKDQLVSSKVIDTLKRSQAIVTKLAQKVDHDQFLEVTEQAFAEKAYVDPYRLLVGVDSQQPIGHSRMEWHLNLGLLMNVYNRTQDPELKKQISFLALNYLAKAAPINIEELGLSAEMTAQLEDLFQFGLFQAMCVYHRDVSTFENFVRREIKETLAPAATQVPLFVLTDTSDLSILFPAKFSVMRTEASNKQGLKTEWAEDLADNFIKHFNRIEEDPFHQFLEPPILLDLTRLIGDINTHRNNEKNVSIADKLSHYEELLDEAVDQAIERIKEKCPEVCQNPEDEQKLQVFVRSNIVCVSTTEIKNVGLIQVLPLFSDPQIFEKYTPTASSSDSSVDPEKFSREVVTDKIEFAKTKLDEFVNLTGSRLGGVRGREQIFNFVDLSTLIEQATETIKGRGQMVEYAGLGSNVLYFSDLSKITESALFKKFESHFAVGNLASAPEHAKVLGQATLQLIKGWANEIDEETWIKLNANPDTRQILQTTLYRLMQHLGQAENRIDDFVIFSQAIELAHSELATLLALTHPFKEEDFAEIYKQQLLFIPSELAGLVKVGISKSAMNVFAGINTAVKSQHPDLERVYASGSYYEEVGLIGKNRTTEEVLGNPDVKRVDLYVGEFNHNIILDPNHSVYKPGDIQGEVETLLKAKTETEYLTVAVDCTIDYIHSGKAETLLKHFSKEIQDGKLNFVFFRSGQKYDMLGMDNYYGGTFYMINNGDKKWESFNALMTHDAFKTDALSQQWFCLVNKYAPQATDAYRRQIFENTRAILDNVPEILKPDGNPHVKVCLVEEGVDTGLIDIKVGSGKISDREIELMIHQTFAKYKAKIHSRGSFGFYHPNLNIIPSPNGISIRFNPGIDPKEVAYAREFLDEIAKRVESLAT